MKLAGLTLVSLAMATAATACNIPVFRYALERWKPDPCEVILFYRGSLTAEQEKLRDTLNAEMSAIAGQSGARIVQSDVDQPADAYRSLWADLESEPGVSLPYVVVRTRLGAERVVNGWHGSLGLIEQSGVFRSPVRTELSRRLVAGHSIVWLMIGSPDEQRNAAARGMLTDNFESLAGKVELPEGIGLPGSELYSEIPLLLQFSLLEIDRADPQEQFLVKLLAGFQPEAFAGGQPLLVPVFGRGRALEVIPASAMSVRLMEDLTLFLSGACSCQVKEQNPGFDLLLSADWNAEIFGAGVDPPAPRTTRDRESPTLLTIPRGR